MIKVYYSHTPFWRAEVLRVSLYISNIPFEDVRISRDEFINMIKTGFLPNGKRVPFHQLPVIEVDGKIIGKPELLLDIAARFLIFTQVIILMLQKLIKL